VTLLVGTEFIERSGMALAMVFCIRELEDAIDKCKSGDIDGANHEVDEAVAFWTGSLEGTDGSGDGVLAYALAEKFCAASKTCGESGDEAQGNAAVNIKYFHHLKSMQASLSDKDCDMAAEHRDEAINIMFVPLIQGALQSAYLQNGNSAADDGEAEGEGAAFAAGVLPLVAACNADDAATIFDNMQPSGDYTADFAAVKKAFENNYECLGITCADVGGIYNATTMEYASDETKPCGDSAATATNGNKPSASPPTASSPTGGKSSSTGGAGSVVSMTAFTAALLGLLM
jgi:Low iron-inducible periplasmic protein